MTIAKDRRAASASAARQAAGWMGRGAVCLAAGTLLVGCSIFGDDESKTKAGEAEPVAVSAPASAAAEVGTSVVVPSVGTGDSTVTWTTLAEGLAPTSLEVEDLVVGAGPVATAGSTVLIRYTGQRYSTGEVFESTGEGALTSVRLGSGQAIAGWELGLDGVSEGGTRQLIVPAELAVDRQAAGRQAAGLVTPNEAVVYTIEVVKVVNASQTTPEVSVEPGLVPEELTIVDELVGDGAVVADGSSVAVRYALSSATTGKQVYSGWETGQISQFTVGAHEVVAGLEQGVAGMKVGGTRRLEVPAALAYGDAGTPGGEVQPGEPVVYLVELISIAG